MRRWFGRFLAAALFVTGIAPSLARSVKLLALETRVVAPLADPALVPGVGRCTSDGVCTVDEGVDGMGLRRGTPLALLP